MASIAILAGVEPRPSRTPGRVPTHEISSATSTSEDMDSRAVNVRALRPEHANYLHSSSSVSIILGQPVNAQGKPAAGSPTKKIRMGNKGGHVHHKKEEGWWNGDKNYYRRQVERLGFRFHQPGINVPRRAPGMHRTAEGNNDLRNLLAAQPVSHMGPSSRGAAFPEHNRTSKRIHSDRVNRSTLNLGMKSGEESGNDCASEQQLDKPTMATESAILNSDQVRASLLLNPKNESSKPDDIKPYRKLLGGITSREFDAKIVQRENLQMRREECSRFRTQPAMESTLPISWEKGSSWNPEDQADTYKTSNQVMNAGERIGYRYPFQNARRLGRNRSVLKSQIRLG